MMEVRSHEGLQITFIHRISTYLNAVLHNTGDVVGKTAGVLNLQVRGDAYKQTNDAG